MDEVVFQDQSWSDKFKKILVPAGWAYRVLHAKVRGRHVTLNAEELRLCRIRPGIPFLATVREMQTMSKAERDSLQLIQQVML